VRQAGLIEPIAVACHDVRTGDIEARNAMAVIGGGPIGVLVALVAQNRGARVVIAHVSPFRVDLSRALGIHAVNVMQSDLVAWINKRTGGAGPDVVFEVSGPAAGAR